MEPAVVAALVSAAVAGGIALIKTLLDLSGGGRNDAREAHRELLGAHLASLGRNIPGVVAASNVYFTRSQAEQPLASWQARATAHADGLAELRGDLRYLLYGADGAIRTLSRLASWIQHYKNHADEGRKLLASGDDLRERLDQVIAKSYRRGEPPTRLDRRRLDKAANSLTSLHQSRMGSPSVESYSD